MSAVIPAILLVNALLDFSVRILAVSRSLPDTPEGMKAHLDELERRILATALEVQAYQPLDTA
jgi:hypothetical protein